MTRLIWLIFIFTATCSTLDAVKVTGALQSLECTAISTFPPDFLELVSGERSHQTTYSWPKNLLLLMSGFNEVSQIT